jgi:putative hemolysin
MSLFSEILLLLGLTALNGIFSMYEMAMVSSRRLYLEQKADEGNAGARTALELLLTPNRFLSTVQIGISLITIMLGAFGDNSLGERLGAFLKAQGYFGSSGRTVATATMVVLTTFVTLVLGELIPKRIALNNPEVIASYFSRSMRVLSEISRPIVALLSWVTDLGVRALGIKPKPEPVVTEEEIKLLLQEGKESGVIDEAEQDMVSGVFRLGERRVDAMMTPRTEMVWLDLEDDRETIIREMIESNFSRLPVAKGELDEVIGMLNVKELVGQDLHSANFNLTDFIREAQFIPENMPALKAFEQFRASGNHQALVIDEYGGVQGMVTLYDVLESIAGEIRDDESDLEQEAVQRQDGSWLFDGLIAIDELKDLLGLDEELPDEVRAGYLTLSGFVMNQLGRIPMVGQSFDWGEYRFEVVDMDGRRVDRVLVSRLND